MVIWVLGSIFWSPTFPIHISRHTFLHLSKKWSSLHWPSFLCVHKWLWVWRISPLSFSFTHTCMHIYTYIFFLQTTLTSLLLTLILALILMLAALRGNTSWQMIFLCFHWILCPWPHHTDTTYRFSCHPFFIRAYICFSAYFFLSQHHYMKYDSLIDPSSWWQALNYGFCYYEHCPSTRLCICILICCCLYLCGIDSQE